MTAPNWSIGRVTGWAAVPHHRTSIDVRLVGLTNVMRQVGIAWRDRAEAIVEQLRDYPLARPNGGWPLLVGTARLGLTPAGSPRWPAGTRPANATYG